MPEDFLNIGADASSMLTALKQVTSAYISAQQAQDKFVKQTVAVNTSSSKLEASFRVVGKSGEQLVVTVDKLSGRIKNLKVVGDGTESSFREMTNQIDPLIRQFSLASAEAGNYAKAMKQAAQISADSVRQSTQSIISDLDKQQKAQQSNIVRGLRRGIEAPIRGAPLDVQQRYKEAERALAEFAAINNKTLEQIRKEEARINSEGIKNYNESTQAKAKQLQDLIINYTKARQAIIKSEEQQAAQQKKLAAEVTQQKIKDLNTIIKYEQQQSQRAQQVAKQEADAKRAALNTQLKYFQQQAAAQEQARARQAAANREAINAQIELAKQQETSRRIQTAYADIQNQIANGTLRNVRVTQQYNAATNTMTKNITATTKAGKSFNAVVTTQDGQVKNVTKSIGNMNNATQGLTLSWKTFERLIITSIIYRAIGALTSQMREATSAASDLTVRIAEIQTIQQDAGQSTLKLTEQLFELSDAWGLDVLDQAEAAYQTVSNQVAKGAEAIRFLGEANRLAVTGISSTTDSVNLLTSAINAFGLDIEDTNTIAASFFKTVELGRVRIAAMANTFGRVAVPANQLGLSLNELQAAITVATIKGVQFNEASTLIRNVLLKLIKPTKNMKIFIEELGFESGEAAIKTLGLAEFLGRLEERTQGSSSEIGELFSRIRAITGAMIFAGDGVKRFEVNLRELRDAQESYDKATEEILQSTGKRLDIELNKIRNFFIQQGIQLLEFIDRWSNGFKTITTAVKVLVDVIKTLLVPAIAARLYFAITTKLIPAIYAANGALALIAANPVTAGLIALGAAVAAASAAIRYFEDQAKKTDEEIKASWEARNKALENLSKKQLEIIKRSYADQLRETKKTTANINAAWNLVFRQTQDEYDELADGAKDAFGKIDKAITKAYNNINKAAKESFGTIQDSRKELKDFISDLDNRIFERSLIDKSTSEQIDELEDKLKGIDKQRQQALRGGDVDLAKELLKEYRDVTLRIIDLDQDRLDREKELTERLAEDRKDTEEELKELTTKLAKARRARDKEEEDRLQKEIARIRTNYNKRRREAENELNQLRKNNAGEYFNEYESRLERIKNIAIQQQKDIEKREIERLNRISSIRRELVKKEIDFETEYRKFAQFNLEDAIKQADGDSQKLEQILAQREANIQRLIDISRQTLGPEAEALGIKIPTIDEARIQQLKILQVQEKQRVEQELLNIKLIEYNKQLAASYELLEERRKEQLQERNDQARVLGNLTDTAKELNNLIPSVPLGFLSGPDFVDRYDNIKEALDAFSKLNIKSTPKEIEYATSRLIAASSGLNEIINRFPVAQQVEVAKVAASIERFIGAAKRDFEPLVNLNRELETIVQQQLDLERKQAEEAQKQLEQQAGINSEQRTTESILVRIKNITKDITTAQKELRSELEANVKALNNLTERESKIIQRGLEVEGKARGGFMKGTDTIPAMLSPGEFVVNANATRRFYSQLVNMNAQGLQGFARGGPVTNIGDINVSMQSSGSTETDIVAIGKGLRREIRRGRLRLV